MGERGSTGDGARRGWARDSCRVCLGTQLTRFLSLGDMPLANLFLTAEELEVPEPRFPLEVRFCLRCGQVQLGYVVSPEVLFRHYIYRSSTSDTIRAHFAQYAKEVAWVAGSVNPLIVEVASNDGCLLRALRGRQVRILGVEPARNLAEIAVQDGVPTVNDFFTRAVAEEILREHGPAQAMIANNVLAHVDDLDDFLSGVDSLLAPDGLFWIEVPHLLDLVQKLEFDTIYHEHLSYFAVGALRVLFERFGLQIAGIRKIAVHGGSIRVAVGRKRVRVPGLEPVEQLLEEEDKAGLASVGTFVRFGDAVTQLRDQLARLLRRLRFEEGGRLAGYGAAAKGNTLLNYCRIGRDLLDYIVDRSALKQGLFTPGMHIPVCEPERLLEERPDYVLLLAWNFAEEVLRQQAPYREAGGRFIIPVPQPTVS